jgi:hypothetical protein
VDDVLILTKVDLQEWLEIDKLIVLFCKASGLQVNVSKTTLHFEGLSESDLTPFRSFLPYTFSALDTGFKYLGYHLKTGAQRATDWNWLLIKMEKRLASGAISGYLWAVAISYSNQSWRVNRFTGCLWSLSHAQFLNRSVN